MLAFEGNRQSPPRSYLLRKRCSIQIQDCIKEFEEIGQKGKGKKRGMNETHDLKTSGLEIAKRTY